MAVVKKRGKWAVVIYENGRHRQLGTFPASREGKKAAKEVEAAWLRDQPGSGLAPKADVFAKTWTRDYPRPRASTNRHNHERVLKFADDFKGTRLSHITRPTARRWALENPGRLSAVRAMYGDALNDGLVQTNPFAGLRLPQGRGRKDITALTQTELHELADAALNLGAVGPELRAMVLFSGYVGCRPGELFGLRADDVSGDIANVREGTDRQGKSVATKNGETRLVPLPKLVRDALDTYPPHGSGLLFQSPMGKRWTVGSFGHYWRQIRAAAGRPGLQHYELRHCAATMLLERGLSPWDVAIVLGHVDGGQLVQERYGHPAHDAARARVLAAWDGVSPVGVRAVKDAS